MRPRSLVGSLSVLVIALLVGTAGCSSSRRSGEIGFPPYDAGAQDASGHDAATGHDGGSGYDAGPRPDAGPIPGDCMTTGSCYKVYAHSDHVLYQIDLMTRSLVMVGPFNAPMVSNGHGGMSEDVVTDLAVAPDDTIYGISHTELYTVSSTDGHVTTVGPITNCGAEGVALTFMPDGTLYTGDFQGALCRIDPTTSPPTVTPVSTLSGGYALSGDIVGVADGTMYGTAYLLSDPSGSGTQANNVLVQIDPTTGHVTPKGPTGFPRLYGVAYQIGKVFGFTHDGTGDVITIDPRTGAGTLFGTFTDPSTGNGIRFAGAAVNANVPPMLI